MMNIDNYLNRKYLDFANEVKKNFSFLCDLGFKIEREEITFIQYKNLNLSINIFHGRKSYEIGLELVFNNENEIYSIPELLRFIDFKKGKNYKYFAPSTKEGVKEGVRQLTEAFQYCVNAGILNRNDLQIELKKQGKKIIEEFALKMNLESAIQKADKEWKKKDYKKYVGILQPFKDMIDKTHKKKYDYALKNELKG